MTAMEFVYDDGGRKAAGYQGSTGDCVCRAIAIATGKPYTEIYTIINSLAVTERASKKRRGKSNARTGVYKPTYKRLLLSWGWTWTAAMGIGTGCTVRLRSEELPQGRLLVAVSRHLVAVLDGVLHDTHDCSRDGTRCVYGYFSKAV